MWVSTVLEAVVLVWLIMNEAISACRFLRMDYYTLVVMVCSVAWVLLIRYLPRLAPICTI